MKQKIYGPPSHNSHPPINYPPGFAESYTRKMAEEFDRVWREAAQRQIGLETTPPTPTELKALGHTPTAHEGSVISVEEPPKEQAA